MRPTLQMADVTFQRVWMTTSYGMGKKATDSEAKKYRSVWTCIVFDLKVIF